MCSDPGTEEPLPQCKWNCRLWYVSDRSPPETFTLLRATLTGGEGKKQTGRRIQIKSDRWKWIHWLDVTREFSLDKKMMTIKFDHLCKIINAETKKI